jgi:hypothetical protein
VAQARLLEAFEAHLAATDDVTDSPTAIALEQGIARQRAHTAAAGRLPAELRSAPAAQWLEHLDAGLRAVGGIAGQPSSPAQPHAWQRPQRPTLTAEAARDVRCPNRAICYAVCPADAVVPLFDDKALPDLSWEAMERVRQVQLKPKPPGGSTAHDRARVP